MNEETSMKIVLQKIVLQKITLQKIELQNYKQSKKLEMWNVGAKGAEEQTRSPGFRRQN